MTENSIKEHKKQGCLLFYENNECITPVAFLSILQQLLDDDALSYNTKGLSALQSRFNPH